MTFRRNIVASYASQIYITLIAIVILPTYLKYLGAEAYGLVGFFVVLQTWFQILDMGFGPTITRITARTKDSYSSNEDLRALLRSLECVFVLIGSFGALLLIVSAKFISIKWLKLESLPISDAVTAIRLMAFVILFRWFGELYRSVISGYEKILWMAYFNSIVATVRLVVIVPFLVYADLNIIDFFNFQLVAAIIEMLILMFKAYSLLPQQHVTTNSWSLKPLKQVLPFAMAMGFATLVWLVASQSDKILLSGLLALSDYGVFSMATSIAGGVLMLSAPVISVILPRFAALHAGGNERAMLSLYRSVTQWVGVLVWPTCWLLVEHSERLIWAWTGDPLLATAAAPILSLYALGNGVMAVGALPYYLQYAKGHLRLHLVGTFLFVLILIPSLFWAVNHYGAVGAGGVWLFANSLYFLIWIPIAHKKYAPGLHLRWILVDVMAIFIVALITSHVSRYLTWPQDRTGTVVLMFLTSLCVFCASALASSQIREKCREYITSYYLNRYTPKVKK